MVVPYINIQDGTCLRSLWMLAWHIVLWVQNKFLSQRSLHIPFVKNLGADFLLRPGLRPGEWRLNPQTFSLIWQQSISGSVHFKQNLQVSSLVFSTASGGQNALAHTCLKAHLYACLLVKLKLWFWWECRKIECVLFWLRAEFGSRIWYLYRKNLHGLYFLLSFGIAPHIRLQGLERTQALSCENVKKKMYLDQSTHVK